MSNFSKVGTFMKTFGQEVKTEPSFSTDKINKLRIDLIKEELEELTEAINKKDLLEVADALTDILYVTYGAGHAFGIDLDRCFEEVQNSNMSKLDENGKPIYNKLLKTYRSNMSNFSKVGTFMKTFGQEVKSEPSLSSEKINKLRIELIKEELEELTEAMNKKDLLEVADALTDILYVTYGAGHAFGIDLDKCFEEVQNSNMSKLGENGKPIYNDAGKVMKGPNYFKPDLSKFVS